MLSIKKASMSSYFSMAKRTKAQRSAAARKAARTRKRNQAKRKATVRKAARSRRRRRR